MNISVGGKVLTSQRVAEGALNGQSRWAEGMGLSLIGRFGTSEWCS